MMATEGSLNYLTSLYFVNYLLTTSFIEYGYICLSALMSNAKQY